MKRIILFFSLFIVSNLAFIPLLSLYGTRVCPILPLLGFKFGCLYTGSFILIVNTLNILFIFLYLKASQKKSPLALYIQKRKMRIYATIYLIATIIAIVVLQILLHMNHIDPFSRGPEILILASLLLGLTQSYGLDWALQHFEERSLQNQNKNLRQLWFHHITRTLTPILLAVIILIHFLIRQSEGFNLGHIAPMATHDSMIDHATLVIFFVLIWLIMTFSFHLLAEKNHVIALENHLKQLKAFHMDYRSNLSTSWGLWSFLLDQLNQFSLVFSERTRLLKSFSRFVTKEVATEALGIELKETGGVSRDLTVMMSDIRNFTSMSEKLDPQQVVTLLNEYFTVMLDVMSTHQILVDKYIGDGILAYVETDTIENAPASAENHLAVEAALEMLKKMGPLNEQLAAKGLPELKIGLGIYRGPVVIGLIGSESKLQHTIIGDTVNRAARLESLCKELSVSVVIDISIWQSLTPNLQNIFRPMGAKNIKGLTENIELFGGPFY